MFGSRSRPLMVKHDLRQDCKACKGKGTKKVVIEGVKVDAECSSCRGRGWK